MRGLYILDANGAIQPVTDVLQWAEWMESHEAESRIGNTRLPDNTVISTIFLGIDLLGIPPRVFETMIFGGEHHHYMDRYHTRDEAVIGHQRAVMLASGKEKTNGHGAVSQETEKPAFLRGGEREK
jgi:hypothetical protein